MRLGACIAKNDLNNDIFCSGLLSIGIRVRFLVNTSMFKDRECIVW